MCLGLVGACCVCVFYTYALINFFKTLELCGICVITVFISFAFIVAIFLGTLPCLVSGQCPVSDWRPRSRQCMCRLALSFGLLCNIVASIV